MKRIFMIMGLVALLGVSAQSFTMFSQSHCWGGYDYAGQVGLVAFRSQSNKLRYLENELQEGEVIVAELYAFRKEGKYSETLYIMPTTEGNATAAWQDENGTEGHFLNLIDSLVKAVLPIPHNSIERLACGQEIPRSFNPYKKY